MHSPAAPCHVESGRPWRTASLPERMRERATSSKAPLLLHHTTQRTESRVCRWKRAHGIREQEASNIYSCHPPRGSPFTIVHLIRHEALRQEVEPLHRRETCGSRDKELSTVNLHRCTYCPPIHHFERGRSRHRRHSQERHCFCVPQWLLGMRVRRSSRCMPRTVDTRTCFQRLRM